MELSTREFQLVMVPLWEEKPSAQAVQPLESASIRFLVNCPGGGAGRERIVAPVGVMSVSVVFDAPSMSSVGGFFSSPPPFPCLTRSKNPIGRVSTPDLGREGGKEVVGEGGFMDDIDPGVLGADVVVVRFDGAE